MRRKKKKIYYQCLKNKEKINLLCVNRILVLDRNKFVLALKMRISVAKFGGAEELLTVEIASDLSIKDLKVIIESESDFGINANEMNLYNDGKFVDFNFNSKFDLVFFFIFKVNYLMMKIEHLNNRI
jgi:hypothetical protein